MATRRPTRALWQTIGVIGIADENSSAGFLFLEVTLQAQRCVAFVEQTRVDRAVRRVTTDAAFFQCFMLENEWTGLRGVTLETGFVLTEQQCSAAFHRLRQARSSALDGATDVRIMAIRAAHLAFQHRMVMRHFKSSADFEVALEARVRRTARIDDLAFIATGRDMQTSRAMT